ncbi:copper chaperone PCu(A)C [Qipengyuania nanhaisediminis]|uniref:copper chaperone PCu(A)C n=1 Tax=Qipengyuania nanhaisediminis TaxID=604088 RepID=UPI0038B30526
MRGSTVAMGAAALLTLSACGGEAEVAEAPPEGVIEGVTIENARMVLPPVPGNPAAVYFDFSYEGDRAFSLGRVSVEGAESATMHQYGEYNFEMQMMDALPIPVSNGTTIEFKPGDYHVMAMDVSPEIEPGDTAEVTLTVSGGRQHKFDAEVRAAGDER